MTDYLNSMGAKTVLTYHPYIPTKPTLARTRAHCRRYALPLLLGDAVAARSLSPALFTVLAPGPPSMPGGRLLRAILGREGLDLDDGAWINYPPWDDVGQIDQAIMAAGSTKVLVVGVEALKLYR